ncbi:hypothetical protein P4O66_015687, partial [Electrophorus voltai]
PKMADGDPEGEQWMRRKETPLRKVSQHQEQAERTGILLANVQSLHNKLDNLRARIKFQRDIRNCNLLCFTKSWLIPVVLSHAIHPVEFFSVHRMDRTADSGKSRGSGVCVMVNNSWCNNANVVTHSCSPNLELLALKFRSFYLPREFTSVIVNTVYIPPQANTDTALWELEALTQFQAQPWDAALIVVGDFNSANLKHCSAQPLPARNLPYQGKEVTRPLLHPIQGQLQGASSSTVCTDDVSEFTEAVVGFIGKLVDDTIPRATIKKFPNQKPWVDKTIREALNSRAAVYNVGIISGNMDEYKSAACRVHRVGLWTIMDYRRPPSRLMSVDESLANELNTFFARFEATSSSANANSASANNANGAIGTANGTCAEATIEQHPLIIMESDMRRVFKRVNTRKAVEPDGICDRVLKACADQTCHGPTTPTPWQRRLVSVFTTSDAKKDFRLPSKVLRNFNTSTNKTILMGNITVWFRNRTKQDRQALQRVVRSAEHITHTEFLTCRPSITSGVAHGSHGNGSWLGHAENI